MGRTLVGISVYNQNRTHGQSNASSNFEKKHGLNAENVTSAQSFSPFGKAVLLLLKSML